MLVCFKQPECWLLQPEYRLVYPKYRQIYTHSVLDSAESDCGPRRGRHAHVAPRDHQSRVRPEHGQALHFCPGAKSFASLAKSFGCLRSGVRGARY
eukprot:720003-Rhodomonas_salina.1